MQEFMCRSNKSLANGSLFASELMGRFAHDVGILKRLFCPLACINLSQEESEKVRDVAMAAQHVRETGFCTKCRGTYVLGP